MIVREAVPVAFTSVELTAPGHQPVIRKLKLVPGKPVDLGTLKFSAAARLAGKVISAEGKPMPFVAVYSRSGYLVNADAEGRFVADGLKPGSAVVFALSDSNEGPHKSVKLIAGSESTVELTAVAGK